MTAKQYMNHKEQLRAAFTAALGFPPSDVHLFRIVLYAKGGKAA